VEEGEEQGRFEEVKFSNEEQRSLCVAVAMLSALRF
jgi:hypothetical protein